MSSQLFNVDVKSWVAGIPKEQTCCNSVLIKNEKIFNLLAHFLQKDKFLLNCIYCTNIGVAELAHCCIQAVSEKMFHSPICISRGAS